MSASRIAAAVLEFLIGDDWRTAAGVVGGLAATALLVGLGLPAWPLTIVATIGVLLWSVKRASAEHRRFEWTEAPD